MAQPVSTLNTPEEIRHYVHNKESDIPPHLREMGSAEAISRALIELHEHDVLRVALDTRGRLVCKCPLPPMVLIPLLQILISAYQQELTEELFDSVEPFPVK